MIERKEDGATEVLFDSVVEIENAEFANKLNERNQKDSERRGDDIDWWGVRGGYNEVKKLVACGWNDGMEKALTALHTLNIPRLKTMRRRKVRSDFGDHLDMQAVYGGNLDRAWESTHREAGVMQQGQTVTLAVDLGANCDVEAGRMFWRGAAATVLCDELQKSGRNVRVVGYSVSDAFNSSRELKCVMVVLKDYQDALDMNSLIVTTALSGFFRSYIFKAKRLGSRTIKDSLGRHNGSYKPAMLEEESDVVYIKNVWDRYAAQELLIRVGEQING